MKIEIKDNKKETIDYADTKLTKDLLNKMQRTKKNKRNKKTGRKAKSEKKNIKTM